MGKDYNQCRGCYKCVHDACTASSCWFDRMKPYTDYVKNSGAQIREAKKQALHAQFLKLWKRGLTDTRIALETCVSQPTVSKWRRAAGLEANKRLTLKNGAAIRRLRLALGLTQEAFGKRYGVTQRTVGHWEDGDYQAPLAVREEAERCQNENRPTELEPLASG